MKNTVFWSLVTVLSLGASPVDAKSEPTPNIEPTFFKAYVADVERRLNRFGYPERTKAKGGTSATIGFTIAKDGKASDIHLETSTGDDTFNRVCLKNVEDRSPFRPFPCKLSVKVIYRPSDLSVTAKVENTK